MKQLVFTILLCLVFSAQSIAQNTQEAISARAAAYFDRTEKKDWNAVMDMLYPKLFELVTKDEMAEVFKSIDSEGMKMDMKNFALKKISDVVTHEGEKFALVEYNVEMNIQFTSVEYRDAAVQAMIKASFEGLYGTDNVIYNKDDYSFDIKAARSMFAISEAGKMKWYFIENDSSQKELTAMLIPEPVIERLLVTN